MFFEPYVMLLDGVVLQALSLGDQQDDPDDIGGGLYKYSFLDCI